MGFNQHSRVRGRVRVTERILSEPDTRGYRTVLCRAGEILSIAEAFRRRIPEEFLEPVGPAGQVAFAKLAEAAEHLGAEATEDEIRAAITEAEQAARDVDRQEQQAIDRQRVDNARRRNGGDTTAGDDQADDEEPEGFPRHRGGGFWELSDGTRTPQMTREDAEAAEAALHTPEAPDEEPEAADGEDAGGDDHDDEEA